MNEKMLDRDETVRELLDAMGELVNEGLKEIANVRPAIAANVVQLVEQKLGSLRITIDIMPLPTLRVSAVSFDGELDQKLFTISLKPIPASAMGDVSVN